MQDCAHLTLCITKQFLHRSSLSIVFGRKKYSFTRILREMGCQIAFLTTSSSFSSAFMKLYDKFETTSGI
jgi:hypothetical protein